MVKRLTAKVDTYQKDGQEKGKYVEIGALMTGNDGSEFVILEPHIDLAGILLKQNALAAKSGKPQRDSIMVGVYSNDNQQQGQAQQGGYQQQTQGGYQQQAPQQSQQQAPQQGQQPQGGYQQQAPQQVHQPQGVTNDDIQF